MIKQKAALQTSHRRSLPMLLFSLLLVMVAAPDVSSDPTGPISVPNPGAELWRAVRERPAQPPPGRLPQRPDTADVTAGIAKQLANPAAVAARTQVGGVDSARLINPYGEGWRLFRTTHLIPVGGYALVGILGAILAFGLLRGRVRIHNGYSGQVVKRYSDFERVLHWFLAGVFIFLALSGLILLFGRSLLLPLLGPQGFSVLASAAKEGHNLFGPLFLAAILGMFFTFASRNLYARGDLTWMLKGGGMLGSHAGAGFFNMGEKIWFWVLILCGLAVSLSGFTLLFPNLGTSRTAMELALMSHGVAALILIGFACGHIYLGTYGTEGALRGMTDGYVDRNWARSHHDRWARECEEKGEVVDDNRQVWQAPESEQESP